MPLLSTLGAASAQAFGAGARQAAGAYIEDVFSTYLYTGNGSTQTITNGIDLSGKGGLVWLKSRSAATDNALYDTARGATIQLVSNTANAQTTQTTGLTSFLSNGFSIGALSTINTNAATYASWTFRKQPKFFDVITYTGNGANRTISHNLGSVPGMIIIKRTDTTGAWAVYHNALANTEYLILNTTAAKATGATYWNSTTPTSTVFSLGTATDVNANGSTYVAYLYASNAGGFGADGSQNVISCGSFTTDGSGNATVSLGWEPQYFLHRATTADNWRVVDNMRGMSVGGIDAELLPNNNNSETSGSNRIDPTATGFTVTGRLASTTYIYLAIRRGPMRTPTDATKVFSPSAASGVITTGFPIDLNLIGFRSGLAQNAASRARLIGGTPYLVTSSSSAEATGADIGFASNTGLTYSMSANWINWNFQRAPGFMDVVCYTSPGTNGYVVNHNLGVKPELIIVKGRSWAAYYGWGVYAAPLGSYDKYLFFNLTNAVATGIQVLSAEPTATQITWGNGSEVAFTGGTAVAYLFATCPGVSKVGSYTGTGATQTISCGFTGGARYVMIKRTDSTGDWWVWDTARGMISGTDPRLAYNSTAAEANADWVYTTTGGFQIVTSDATVNASGGSYIYLAIA